MAEDVKQLIKAKRAAVNAAYNENIVAYRAACEKIKGTRDVKATLMPLRARLNDLNRKVKTQELTAAEIAEIKAIQYE